MQLSFNAMFDACLQKDKSFEGIFYTAVKTTGIFCRPSCPAKKPRAENVEFFQTSKEAMLKGYRPCKVCRPLEKPGETPPAVRQLLDELSADPSRRFKDGDLRKRNIEPAYLRRWFLKNHGITFHAYQRMYRINSAFKKLQQGESVGAAAYTHGYESASGFADGFRRVFGIAPDKSKHHCMIDLKRIETPIGTMLACASGKGLCLLEFGDRRMLESELMMLSKRLNATILLGENQYLTQVENELMHYFNGQLQQFSVPLHFVGSGFQQQVWQALLQIPYGETRSYKQQADAVGTPGAVRAVANANGMNKMSIVVPCHRVIGANGQLTGYGGGLWRKQYLLELEKGINKNSV